MEKIYVGKIGKAVGLKGQQKLHIDSDFPEQFKANTKLTTNKDQTLIIESYNHNSKTVKFKDINTIEDAKKLTNRELFVSCEDSKENCKLDKDQFFWFDIIGCKVIEKDISLGVVEDIERMPLSDYLNIKTSKELVDMNYSNNFLLPYIINEYIQSVDLSKKQIIVKGAKNILEAS
ncbi:MAG: ribosome maturation factor RimM [Campylobacterota bacterium]|nr:ribosome maturation factor RimM [Campylobacterota bacterium]